MMDTRPSAGVTAPLSRGERRPQCQPCAPLTRTRPGRIPKEPGSFAPHESASPGDTEGFTALLLGAQGLSRLLL